MKIYYCDICSCQMPEERHMIIPMRRFDGEEDFVIQCKDNCGFRYADICKKCEDKIKNAIQEAIGLGYSVIDSKLSNVSSIVKENFEAIENAYGKVYFDDCEICKFCYDGACHFDTVGPDAVMCDGHNENCRYRDSEKKTLSEAMVKESTELYFDDTEESEEE